jgi:hypothetical protein
MGGALLVAAPVVSGGLYLLAERRHTEVEIEGWPFVAVLVLATAILVAGMAWVHRFIRVHAADFFSLSETSAEAAREKGTGLVDSIFRPHFMTAVGLVYGTAMGAVPFYFSFWADAPGLRGHLSLFLFTVNVPTGIAVTGIVLLLLALVRGQRHIRVTAWNRHNASTRFVDGVRTRIALLAGVYVSLSVSSVPLSRLPLSDPLVIGYWIFAVVLILGAFAIPGFIIRARVEDARIEALKDVDQKLQTSFRNLLEAERVPEEDFHSFTRLEKIRERVEGVAAPVVNWSTVRAGLAVVGAQALPILIAWFSELLEFLKP